MVDLNAIREWADGTFGPCKTERIIERAEEEFDELLVAPPHEIVEEAADVIICLARFPGISEVIEKKMAKNRARTWRSVGDGTGYHVKATTNG